MGLERGWKARRDAAQARQKHEQERFKLREERAKLLAAGYHGGTELLQEKVAPAPDEPEKGDDTPSLTNEKPKGRNAKRPQMVDGEYLVED